MKKLIILAGLLVAGCSVNWYKDGGTEAEFNKDEYECQQASYGYGGVSGYAVGQRGVVVGGMNPRPNRNIYQSCMRAHGYTTQKP